MIFMISLATAAIIVLSVLIYVRITKGSFFQPMFREDFPDELKQFFIKNNHRIHTKDVSSLISRYKIAKNKEKERGFPFPLDKFLANEETILDNKKNFVR